MSKVLSYLNAVGGGSKTKWRGDVQINTSYQIIRLTVSPSHLSTPLWFHLLPIPQENAWHEGHNSTFGCQGDQETETTSLNSTNNMTF